VPGNLFKSPKGAWIKGCMGGFYISKIPFLNSILLALSKNEIAENRKNVWGGKNVKKRRLLRFFIRRLRFKDSQTLRN
jgi:hypothetical protein